MNKYKIEFSDESKNDLFNITNYIKNKLNEPNIAKKLSHRIKKQIFTLAEFPKIYSVIGDSFLRKIELRKIVVDNYIILYQIIDESKKVRIIRIMYGRRNWIEII